MTNVEGRPKPVFIIYGLDKRVLTRLKECGAKRLSGQGVAVELGDCFHVQSLALKSWEVKQEITPTSLQQYETRREGSKLELRPPEIAHPLGQACP